MPYVRAHAAAQQDAHRHRHSGLLAGHPYLTDEEKGAYLDMVATYEQRGSEFDAYAAQPYGYAATLKYIQDTAEPVREVCRTHGLPLEEVTAVAAA